MKTYLLESPHTAQVERDPFLPAVGMSNPYSSGRSTSINSAAFPTRFFNASPRCFTPSRFSVSMRNTGISRRAASGSRYSASVASSAASVSLSARTARAIGSARQAAIAASLPSRIPACGPPSSLSPLNVTTSTPLPTASRTVGSPPPSPHGERSSSRPLPRSYRHRAPRAWATSATSRAATSAVNPVT